MKIKRIVIFFIVGIILFIIPSLATEKENTSAYAEADSVYTIILPKQIIIDSITKSANYTIICTTYSENLDYISIIPEYNFKMYQNNKNSVIATIEQDITNFKNINNIEELSASETLITDTIIGTINVPDLSAGNWNGSFNFVISSKKKDKEFTLNSNNMNLVNISIVDGVLNIPGYFDYENERYKITKIDNNAFEYYSNINTLILPDTIKEIGDFAFHNCTMLTTVNIPDGAVIGTSAFQYCSNLVTLTFDGKITDIKEGAFLGCANLKTVEIPEGITVINNSVFYNCSNLNYVKLPETLQIIDDYAFTYCTNLKEITIPQTVTTIGKESFYNCIMLNLNVPNNIISIGRNAFAFLPKIYYSGNATYDEDNIYWGAYSLN